MVSTCLDQALTAHSLSEALLCSLNLRLHGRKKSDLVSTASPSVTITHMVDSVEPWYSVTETSIEQWHSQNRVVGRAQVGHRYGAAQRRRKVLTIGGAPMMVRA